MSEKELRPGSEPSRRPPISPRAAGEPARPASPDTAAAARTEADLRADARRYEFFGYF